MNATSTRELVAELQPEIREKIDAILAENLGKPGATMLVLTLVQEEVGYISLPMQSYLAEQMNVPLGHLYGVLTFYSSFRTSPIGQHKVSVC
ncbi:MAG: NAD(P)H-dependent oxidoreductase subunit E, partial [Anaerolineae bacterium]|nr:NAD(P)H-dependent oxidoreductase subunit E [Anaerolineae bacterium]